MSDTSWKAFERRVAERVGGKRIPVTGERDGADVIAGPFVYQAKLRRGLPSYLRDWLRGIVAAGERSGTTGVVVWKAPREKDNDAVVGPTVERLASLARRRVGVQGDRLTLGRTAQPPGISRGDVL